MLNLHVFMDNKEIFQIKINFLDDLLQLNLLTDLSYVEIMEIEDPA